MSDEPSGWRLRRTWGQRLIIASGALAAAFSLLTATVVLTVRGKVTQVQRVSVGFALKPQAASVTGSRAVNILVVGIDNADGLDADDRRRLGRDDGIRSDTIMLVRLDPESGLAAALSFPRDLWLPLGGDGGRERINAALPLGGPELLLRTITSNFSLPVDHYVEVDFAQFRRLVNVVGGVPMPFDKPVRDDNSGLYVGEPGCVMLDGDTALDYVRSRYLQVLEDGSWQSDGFADLSRIRRQQDFMRRALRRAQAKGLDNPFTANALIDVGLDAVTVDDGFAVADMVALARRFRSLDPGALLTFSLPTEPFETAAGQQVLDLVSEKAEPVLDIFRGINPDAPGAVRVQVTDGSGGGGPVASDLAAAGFQVVGGGAGTPGDEATGASGATGAAGAAGAAGRTTITGPDVVGGSVPARTSVRFRPLDRYRAESLARWLVTEPELVEVDELDTPGGIDLLVGADYQGVLGQPRPGASFWQPPGPPVGLLPGEGNPSLCG